MSEQREPSMMELLEIRASTRNPYDNTWRKREELENLLQQGHYSDRRGNRVKTIAALNTLTWQSTMELLSQYHECINSTALGRDISELLESQSDFIRKKILGEDRNSMDNRLMRELESASSIGRERQTI